MAYGPGFYDKTAMMGRNFLGIQRMRVAAGARVRRFRDDDKEREIIRMQLDYIRLLTKDEKKLLKDIVTLAEDHELWHWCQAVKGLGPMACATFLSYLNPYKANTAGKGKAYMGLIPGSALKKGQKAGMNPTAKGRMYIVTTNIIRLKDPYYSALYHMKKDYYTARMGEYLTDPSKCPLYAECMKGLAAAAEREGRPMKKTPCKLHIDNMAKRWVSGLLVSHALELMRVEEGLDVDAFHAHRGYIPIPPH